MARNPVRPARRPIAEPKPAPGPVLGGLALAAVVLVGGIWWIGGRPEAAPQIAPPTSRSADGAAASSGNAVDTNASAGAASRPFMDPAGAAAVAYTAGDHHGAQAHYLAAIERNPDDAEAHSNLGQVLVRLGQVEEALPHFDRAISLIPERWAYQFNRARALGLLEQWEAAIAGYRRAQQIFPEDYATAFNLGQALHRSGDESGAVGQYLRAIALEPSDASFRLALGISYERLQKPADAAAAYAEYLRLAPAATDADKVRARIAHLTGS